jgi:hypothetical protein
MANIAELARVREELGWSCVGYGRFEARRKIALGAMSADK